MATATMTFNGSADGVANSTFTHVGTVPDALIPSFFAAYRNIFGQVPTTDAQGNPQFVPDPANPALQVRAMRDMTDAETWERYTQSIADSTTVIVQAYLHQQAVAVALASLPPIAVTQTQ